MRAYRKNHQERRVHVEGEEWTYRVGETAVVIRDPQGKTTVVQRERLEDRSTGLISPSLIKDYVLKWLRPGIILPAHETDPEKLKDAILDFFCGAPKLNRILMTDRERERQQFAGVQKVTMTRRNAR